MAKAIKRDFNAEVGTTISRVLEHHADEELTIRELAKLVAPQLDRDMLDGLRDEAVVHFIHRIMRSNKFKDEHGDSIRRFHCYKKFIQTEEGEEKQLDIWRTIDTMTFAQMGMSARARLKQAAKIAESVAADVRYWDEHVAPAIHSEPLFPHLGIDDKETK